MALAVGVGVPMPTFWAKLHRENNKESGVAIFFISLYFYVGVFQSYTKINSISYCLSSNFLHT
jgi:hypothetical protein